MVICSLLSLADRSAALQELSRVQNFHKRGIHIPKQEYVGDTTQDSIPPLARWHVEHREFFQCTLSLYCPLCNHYLTRRKWGGDTVPEALVPLWFHCGRQTCGTDLVAPPTLVKPGTSPLSKSFDTQKIKANLAHKAKVAAVSAAAVQIAAAEAARNGPKVTPASLAAAAERRRNNSPLEFSGDVVPSTKAAQAAARPETSSTNSSRSSAAGLGSGCHDGGGGHRTPRQTPASAGAEVGTVNQVRDNMKQGSGQSLDMLQEKEQRLDALEKVLRKREEAVNSFVQTIPAATAGGVKKANDVRARGVATTASVGATNAQPPRTQRVQPASATALRRQRAGGQHLHVRRPASSSTAGGEHGQGRPQSARSGRSLKSRTEEEEKLIARCQALSAARRKAANQRRMSPTQAPNRPETQPDPPKVDHHNPDNTDSVRKPPTVPATPPSSEDPRTQIEAGLEREMIGETHRTNAASPSPADDHYKATETRAGETVVARVPSRPRSAVAICRREVSPRPRPRSAATSRSVGADSDKARGESLVGSGGGGNSISTVSGIKMCSEGVLYEQKNALLVTQKTQSSEFVCHGNHNRALLKRSWRPSSVSKTSRAVKTAGVSFKNKKWNILAPSIKSSLIQVGMLRMVTREG